MPRHIAEAQRISLARELTDVGKSALASLVPRFCDVTAGAILFDNRDVREYTLESLRRQISIVLQDVFLFYGSVRDNILFGSVDASDERMMAAARAANAHGFIMELPDGFATMIGERGVKLSGGQKQRLHSVQHLAESDDEKE